MIQGNIAGVVLQCVGRVARGSHMNIISLDSMFGKKIPVYTKGQEERDNMIKEYYKYCNRQKPPVRMVPDRINRFLPKTEQEVICIELKVLRRKNPAIQSNSMH